jgi:nucleotidyltransferase substrate binding protein (TIGR01987 family)
MSVRWEQRYNSFDRAFLRLKEAIEVQEPNELERNGLVQRFEFTIDLSWKLIKDYLEFEGHTFKPSPKETLRLANQTGLIDFAQVLIDGLDVRNVLSHDDDGEKFEESEFVIRNEIFPALQPLQKCFAERIAH